MKTDYKARKIVFRGKRVDTKEWVFGYVVYDKKYGKCYIYTGEYTNSGHWAEPDYLTRYEVIPETVSEFTGLLDKNKNKIFEGDIIQIRNGRTFIIEYFSDITAFIARTMDESFVRPCINYGTMQVCEVIGTIFD